MPRTSNSKNKVTPQTTSLPLQPVKPVEHKTPGLFDTIKQGFAFGVGSSMAHNVVNSVMSVNRPAGHTEKKHLCAKQEREYDLCLHNYMTDISASCDNEITSLIQCYKL